MSKYLKIDKELIFSPKIGAKEKLVLLALMDTNKISYTKLAEKINVSKRTAIKTVKSLEDMGVITHKSAFCENGTPDMNEYEIVGLRGEHK